MASRSEQFIVDNQGKKIAVLIPMQRYERIMEDLHDLAIVAERKEEIPISLAEMKKRLRQDGII